MSGDELRGATGCTSEVRSVGGRSEMRVRATGWISDGRSLAGAFSTTGGGGTLPYERGAGVARGVKAGGRCDERIRSTSSLKEGGLNECVVPQAEWKAKHQTEATPEQLQRMQESVAKNRADH